MAEGPDYVSPIIEAMINTARLGEVKASREADTAAEKERQKLRESQFKELQKQFEMTHELDLQKHEATLKQLEADRVRADAESFFRKVQSAVELNKFQQSGGDPGEALKQLGIGGLAQQQIMDRNKAAAMESLGISAPAAPQETPSAQPQYNYTSATTGLPGQSMSPVGGSPFFNLQRAEENIRRLTAAKEDVETAAKIKVQQDKDAFDEKMKKLENTWATDKAALDRTQAIKLENLRGFYQMQVAEINAAGKTEGKLPTPDELQRAVGQAFVGKYPGVVKPTSPYDRMVADGLRQIGGEAVDPKTIDSLQRMQNLGPAYNSLREYMDLLAKNRGAAFFQGLKQTALGKVGYVNELENKFTAVRANAIRIGTDLEGLSNRPIARQVAADFDSLPQAGVSRDQAMYRLNNLVSLFRTIHNNLIAGIPQDQMEAIYAANGIKTPDEFFSTLDRVRGAQKKLPSGLVLDEDESIRRGKPAYRKP